MMTTDLYALGLATLLAFTSGSALADPCPDLLEPGTIKVKLTPEKNFSGDANRTPVRVTLWDMGGSIIAQEEDDASDFVTFWNIQPGEYSLTMEGEQVETVQKRGVAVVAKRTTSVLAVMRSR